MTGASPGPTAAPAAPARGGASAERMLATVRELAADVYTGRRIGTPGGRASAAWLADQLRTLGATVRLDEFEVAGVKELQATPTLTIGQQALVHRRDFAEQLTSAEIPVPGSGLLATAEAESWTGRWVAVEAADQQVVERACADKAAGLLVPRGVDEAGWMPKMIAGPPAGEIAVLSVRAGLYAGLARRAGETVTASIPLRTVATTGANVYGVFAAPTGSRLSVLLTAHFDGVGDDPQQRHPAAADNASGVAVVLEVARLLSAELPPAVGLAVALLDGEEAGARGSAHHAPQLAAGTFVLNVDGAARLGAAAAVEAGGPAELLLAAVDQAGRRTGVPLRAGPMASDNRRYAAAGLPAIGIGMGMPGYQTPAETPDKVEGRTLLAAAALIRATVDHLIETSAQLGETP
ncbi:M28 family metallopeptidase [Kribbella sp. CA-293567]|uniref:M28 family metallopeptidase n=1 Tax=Kribbella sp. CA-293567 TaxID=3002436 RepID=UPI0022DD2685|nr:M28 family peptidase [Kribbella sp. CA-293567]WBQ05124.1 M28 family peptidase [Kribbella sp. CA-293567]